jgi:hypothetical protein
MVLLPGFSQKNDKNCHRPAALPPNLGIHLAGGPAHVVSEL